MHKNLKKVISAVAALALSASSFVALAATKFPDVAETANYAQAVDELTSLKIVNGYEDGTFGPDRLVTRAEITKMIVAALGAGDLQAAEAAAGQNTQFTDVTGNHWAAGYVSQGVSNGFINGMGDGTFAPESNVTYAQAVKMLVAAIGYQTWAENIGGYPQGYMSYGAQLDITKGVSANNDTELNRGQVAILIDNALNAPLLVRDGYTNDAWGRPQPNLVQKDGEGEDYQTLLTKNHNAYKVNGRVTGTQMSGAGVDNDEVEFQVEKADNFNDEYYKKGEDSEKITAKFGDTDAPSYLFTYSEALIQETDDDEWVILSITASAKNDIVTFDSDLFDSDNKNYNGDVLNSVTNGDARMYVYTSEAKNKTTSYKISDEAKFYVNGREYNFTATKALFDKYVTDNEVGAITLIDAPAEDKTSTSTDGYFDYVMVTYYVDAIVDEVSESAKAPRISFDNQATGVPGYLTVDLDDEDINYNFRLGGVDGEEITVTDLQQDDVLSIAYDVSGSFANSDFYTILVSRDTVEGKVTSYNVDDGYNVGGNYYKAVAAMSVPTLSNGDEYTLYLDVFGKIAKVDDGVSSKLYAVAERVYTDNATGNNFLTIINSTGTKHAYQLKDQTAAVYSSLSSFIAGKATDPQDRVIQYSINSAQEITVKAQLTSADAEEGNDEYIAKSNKIGGVKLSDSSVVLDFVDYIADGDDAAVMGAFTDGDNYKVYGYGRSSSEKTYSFVIVTEGTSSINAESPLAVFSSVGTQDVDGSEYTAATVYSEGEKKVLLTELADFDNMVEGTPFFYALDSDGYVKTVEPVLVDSLNDNIADYNKFRTNLLNLGSTDNGTFVDAIAYTAFKPTAANAKYTAKEINNKDVLVKIAPIVDKDSNSLTLATYNIADGNGGYVQYQTNKATLSDDTYADSVSVVVYEYSVHSAGKKVSVGSKGSAIKSTIDRLSRLNVSDEDKFSWMPTDTDSSIYTDTNFALVKTVDKDITDMYVILADTE